MLNCENCRIRRITISPTAKGGQAQMPGIVQFQCDFSPELAKEMRCETNFYDRSGEWTGEIASATIAYAVASAELSLFEKGKKLYTLNAALLGFTVEETDDGPRLTYSAQVESSTVVHFARWLFDHGKYFSGTVISKNAQMQMFDGPSPVPGRQLPRQGKRSTATPKLFHEQFPRGRREKVRVFPLPVRETLELVA